MRLTQPPLHLAPGLFSRVFCGGGGPAYARAMAWQGRDQRTEGGYQPPAQMGLRRGGRTKGGPVESLRFENLMFRRVAETSTRGACAPQSVKSAKFAV
jgi:hypothetical protein